MTTKAKAAKGTQLKIGDGGGSEVFTKIAEVTSLGEAGATQTGDIDVTSFDSTAVEVISDALPDHGEITFGVNWVASNAQQQQLIADCEAGTLRNFRIEANDHASTPSTLVFAAIVKKHTGLNADSPKAAYKSSVTLRVSGAMTRTYAP